MNTEEDEIKVVEMKYAQALSNTWYAALLALPTAAGIFSVQVENWIATGAFAAVAGLVYYGLVSYNTLCRLFNELQLMTLMYHAANGTLSEHDGLTTAHLGDDDEEDA